MRRDMERGTTSNNREEQERDEAKKGKVERITIDR
jgi:hypothetical protein